MKIWSGCLAHAHLVVSPQKKRSEQLFSYLIARARATRSTRFHTDLLSHHITALAQLLVSFVFLLEEVELTLDAGGVVLVLALSNTVLPAKQSVGHRAVGCRAFGRVRPAVTSRDMPPANHNRMAEKADAP